MYKPVVLFLLFFASLSANYIQEWRDVPAAYKGRFRPVEVYSRLWLYSFHHRQTLKKSDFTAFNFLWDLHFFGHELWDNTPLFWIHHADLKNKLNLDPNTDLFSYKTLRKKVLNKPVQEEFTALINILHEFEFTDSFEAEYNKSLAYLRSKNFSSKKIEQILETQFPLLQRLEGAGTSFKVLPGRYGNGIWFSLKALKTKIYNGAQDKLEEVGNFTLYPDPLFNRIKATYLQLEAAVLEHSEEDINSFGTHLAVLLKEGYSSIEGKIYQKAFEKSLAYPSHLQLKAETIYYTYPWILFCIALYSIAMVCFILQSSLKKPLFAYGAFTFLIFAFCLHTLILAVRCYILERPPVSNMFETIIYVPWIAVLASFIMHKFLKNTLILAASSFVAIALLIILQLTHVNSSLENVQAVLDSQYWLIVHVLMVVGSYGIFFLSGIMGHFYLAANTYYNRETDSMKSMAQFILQTMYLGTALLIPGTILGGVWAAESWGRFWDWDPKESWAFISSCLYVIWVHAYRFQRIGNFGLAIGSIVGLQAITFTWYGVNYILGTGLHSYGFGSGGEPFYYMMLILEIFFITIAYTRQKRTRMHEF